MHNNHHWHSVMVSILASGPRCPEFNSKRSQKFSEENIVDVAVLYQRHFLEDSGRWLENVDQTHLVLASVKKVLKMNQ